MKAEREYYAIGKDFLERGIQNNPDQPQLYEALARLYQSYAYPGPTLPLRQPAPLTASHRLWVTPKALQ